MTVREELIRAMAGRNEVFPDDVEGMTLTDEELDCTWRIPEFTLWTKNRVYFMYLYDGDSSEWIASVPRHPCDERFSTDWQKHGW